MVMTFNLLHNVCFRKESCFQRTTAQNEFFTTALFMIDLLNQLLNTMNLSSLSKRFQLILIIALKSSCAYGSIDHRRANGVESGLFTHDEQVRTLFDFDQDDLFIKYTATEGKCF